MCQSGFESTPVGGPDGFPDEWAEQFPNAGDPNASWQWAGFGWAGGAFQQPGVAMALEPGQPIPAGTYRAIAIPYWLVLVTFAVPPASYSLRRVRSYYRRQSRLCRCCGYDLRASPDRCPECGAAVSSTNNPRPGRGLRRRRLPS